MDKSQLSVVLVAGLCRERAQRAVDALGVQTVISSIEIVLIDIAPPDIPRLNIPDRMRVVYLSRSEKTLWSQARAEGVHKAASSIVAFIEDHCIPDPDWAEYLIEAHKGPWAAVSYGIKNANPKTYISRACMVCDYGYWLHPVLGGETDSLPSSNVSYKRDLLLSFGEKLEFLLSPDFNLQQAIKRQGLPMFIEPRALIFHENFNRLSDAVRVHFDYVRVVAAKRVLAESWGFPKRVFYGLTVLPGVPVLSVLRLFLSLRGRASLLPLFITSLPVFILSRLWGAVGESMGYLFGLGDSLQNLHQWEHEIER